MYFGTIHLINFVYTFQELGVPLINKENAMNAILIILNTAYDYLGNQNDSLIETENMRYIKIVFIIILLASFINLFSIVTLQFNFHSINLLANYVYFIYPNFM